MTMGDSQSVASKSTWPLPHHYKYTLPPSLSLSSLNIFSTSLSLSTYKFKLTKKHSRRRKWQMKAKSIAAAVVAVKQRFLGQYAECSSYLQALATLLPSSVSLKNHNSVDSFCVYSVCILYSYGLHTVFL